MPIQLIRNDITKMKCDAIVNAANSTLLGGGGVDGAIHRAAGRGLLFECMKLGGCRTGQAKITGGHKLPCSYVIHTVGPVWKGGEKGEKELLESCYRESLKLAKEKQCESIAFPLISSGVYGYPKDRALRVAVDTISAFLAENDMLVYIVIFDRDAFQIGEKLFADIKSYIDDNYVERHTDRLYERMREEQCSMLLTESELCEDFVANAAEDVEDYVEASRRSEPKRYAASVWGRKHEEPDEALREPITEHALPTRMTAPEPLKTQTSLSKPDSLKDQIAITSQNAPSLQDMIGRIDESFSQMLLRKIDEKGMTDAECYKKANVDRKLFSKIRGDIHYHPSKPTVIAFAIALELSLEDTRDMLMKAGFALSHSSKFDIIIEYFIRNGNYNIFEINEALFAFDQSLLGA